MHWCTNRSWKKTMSRHNAEWSSRNSTRKPLRLHPIPIWQRIPATMRRTIQWSNTMTVVNESVSPMRMLKVSKNQWNHSAKVQIMFKTHYRLVLPLFTICLLHTPPHFPLNFFLVAVGISSTRDRAQTTGRETTKRTRRIGQSSGCPAKRG